jgi:hypothetical protein
MLHELADNEYDWRPERSTQGPITMVISKADRILYVYRNGEPIGRAALDITGGSAFGNHVFTMLEGSTGKASWFTPGRSGRKWMCVASDNASRRIDSDDIAARLRMNPEFATKLYDVVTPGTTVIVTDQSAARKPTQTMAVLGN